NTGYVIALNEMLQFARGNYLARMDSDDIAMPERFATQVAYLQTHPQCVVVGTAVQLIDPDNAPITIWSNATEHEAIDQRHLRDWVGGIIYHPSAMIRADAMRAVGGYRKEF